MQLGPVSVNDIQTPPPRSLSEVAIFTWKIRNVLKLMKKTILQFFSFWDMIDFFLRDFFELDSEMLTNDIG